MKSPQITSIVWGTIKVGVNQYKDAKLWPGGSRAWDWRETGTHHNPGIQPADITELLDHGSEIIVLSKGMCEKLQITPEAVEDLKNREIELHILQTDEAVRIYNKLAEDKPVGALIHSTC